MRYLRNTSIDPYFNMAFDEFVLEQLPLDTPLFYLWQNRSSVIIGLNQDALAEVDIDYLRTRDIALVRRVTGGGAVYHDLGNLNYTIVGRSADLNSDYPEYTKYILHALQALGVEAELSGRNDILVAGRKVSGYAKRVYKDRLMVHGTLMYNVDLATLEQALNPPAEKLVTKGISSVRSRVANLREYLPEVAGIDDFRLRLERHLSGGYQDGEVFLSDEQLQTVTRMAREKFATEEWTYRRSLSRLKEGPSVVREARLACGVVRVTLQIINHCIAACRFGGDFIGELPSTAMEEALMQVPYVHDALRGRLETMAVGRYFDGVQPDDLLRLLIDD